MHWPCSWRGSSGPAGQDAPGMVPGGRPGCPAHAPGGIAPVAVGGGCRRSCPGGRGGPMNPTPPVSPPAAVAGGRQMSKTIAWPVAFQAFNAPVSAALSSRVLDTGTPFTFRIWSPRAQPNSRARGSATVATTSCFTVRPSFEPSSGCGTTMRRCPAAWSCPTSSASTGGAGALEESAGALMGVSVAMVCGRCSAARDASASAAARTGDGALADNAAPIGTSETAPLSTARLLGGDAALTGKAAPFGTGSESGSVARGDSKDKDDLAGRAGMASSDEGLETQFLRTASSGFGSRPRWNVLKPLVKPMVGEPAARSPSESYMPPCTMSSD
mmetsp:Transcript_49930/g.149129  ORF Transcript_49930/g.149129 Transcript_49930/m.149129 type:complete len:329 (-) Transcript_49930:62-1048(-)